MSAADGRMLVNSGMVTVIAERNPSGHRLYYVRILAQAALLRGDEVVIVVGEDMQDDGESNLFLSDFQEGVTLVEWGDWSIRGLERLSRSVASVVLIIPDADRYIWQICKRAGWHGLGRLSLLVMRSSAQPHCLLGVQAAKTALKRLLIAVVSVFPRINLRVLRSAVWSGTSILRSAYDPVTLTSSEASSSELSRAWNLAGSIYWFAVIGAISDRKNLWLIADSLAKVGSRRVGLVVAGRCDPNSLDRAQASMERIKSNGGAVVVVDRLLEELELDSLVRFVDCVVIAHSNEGPSGLFGKAAATGTRLLSSGAKSLRRDSRAIPSLASWSPLTATALTKSMQGAMKEPRPAPTIATGHERFSGALL